MCSFATSGRRTYPAYATITPMSPRDLYSIDPDALDIVRDDVEFDAASTSTVSNLPGPGRILDKIIGASGRAFERVFSESREQNGELIWLDIEPDALDILRKNDLEFELASISPASDLPGPGRTFGNVVGTLGKTVELACGKIASRLGLSPYAAIGGIVKALSQQVVPIVPCKLTAENNWHRLTCYPCSYHAVLRQVATGQPNMLLLLDAILVLAIYSNDMQRDPKSAKTVETKCRRLIKHLRRDNPASRNAVVYFVMVLKTLLPELAAIFDKNGLRAHLHQIICELSHREPLLRGENLLLARARKALVSTLHSDVLSGIQEYDYLEQQFSLTDLSMIPVRKCVTTLAEMSLVDDVDACYLSAVHLVRTLTHSDDIFFLPFWEQIISVFDGTRVSYWLRVISSTTDPLRKLAGVQLIHGLLHIIQAYWSNHPLALETLWLPMSSLMTDPIAETGMKEFVHITLPLCMSHSLETRLRDDTPHQLRLLQGASGARFEELNSTSFRLMARFTHEWNVILNHSLPIEEELYYMQFPCAVDPNQLRRLCSMMVDTCLPYVLLFG
ncbi:hypothetical protein NEOLEDRAFT_842102 [Neolentinus lepideus HHB14362 ss-1]|uniref:Uncharacterized protein n=1 Tax=Neolentinus lepideus HHB14362 ss-1 TaxID=1314782 RepID=A0A165P4T4_9AGAM|nr:hypothetical protein NEOLEDRAFT_842102 [Neolentinus lepideus HHB14362 ss-1]